MDLVRMHRFVLAALWASAVCGCAAPSPFGDAPRRGAFDATSFASEASFGAAESAAPHSDPARALPQQTIVFPSATQQPLARSPLSTPAGLEATGPPVTEQLVAPLRKAARSLAAATAVESKVIPAVDPVRLSSEPVQPGADLHFHAARAFESQNNIPAAIAQYQKAIALKPNDVRALVGFARLLDRQGEFSQAESFYRRALEIEPNNTIALNDLSMCYARQGATEAAIEVLSRTIPLQPGNVRYRNNIATLLVEAGRPDEALYHLAAVHNKAASHYNLGYLLFRRGNANLARQHLALALQSDPYFEPARQMLNKHDGHPRPPVGQIPAGYPIQDNSSPSRGVPRQDRMPVPYSRPLPPV